LELLAQNTKTKFFAISLANEFNVMICGIFAYAKEKNVPNEMKGKLGVSDVWT
jgi:hypothetical protein